MLKKLFNLTGASKSSQHMITAQRPITIDKAFATTIRITKRRWYGHDKNQIHDTTDASRSLHNDRPT